LLVFILFYFIFLKKKSFNYKVCCAIYTKIKNLNFAALAKVKKNHIQVDILKSASNSFDIFSNSIINSGGGGEIEGS
jgi:hypothetical protein